MKRSCLFIVLVVFLLIINPVYAAPGINTLGGLGINDYGDCSYGNRAGKSLIQKIIKKMPGGSVSLSYSFYDTPPVSHEIQLQKSSAQDTALRPEKSQIQSPQYYP